MKKQRAISAVALGALGVLAVAGCGVDSAEPGDSAEPVGQSSSASFATSGPWWPGGRVPVCWVNPAPENASLRDLVRAIIGIEYEGRTRMSFSGWGTCTDQDHPAVRITIQAVQAASLIGPNDTTASTMSLDLVGLSSDPPFLTETVLHEFGHAVGLFHEQNRLGSPCFIEGDPPGTGTPFGPIDDDSIMNYCRPFRATHLSAGDVFALERMYGGSPGAFVAVPFFGTTLVTRHYRDIYCYVVSSEQLDAFGGPALLGPDDGGGTLTGACAWPDGLYRASDQTQAYFVEGGNVCALASAAMLDVYGGNAQLRVVASGTDVKAGLTDTGTCKWPGGFYRMPFVSVTYRLKNDTACAVANDDSMAVFGGDAAVHSLPYLDLGLLAGHTYTGTCPWGGAFYAAATDNGTVFHVSGDGRRCRVENTGQLVALGGYTLVHYVQEGDPTSSQSPYFNLTSTGDCGWPDGLYQLADTHASYILAGGKACSASAIDVRNYGSGPNVVEAGSDLFAGGRTYTGACSNPCAGRTGTDLICCHAPYKPVCQPGNR